MPAAIPNAHGLQRRLTVWIVDTENLNNHSSLGMMTHASLLALGKQNRQISVSLRPLWSTERLPGQPGLHSETLSVSAYRYHNKIS